MSMISTPDPQEKLRELYRLEKGGPVPTMAPEIVPVAIVDDISGLNEFNNERLNPVTTFASVAAVAAQYTWVYLYNPADSGVNAVIERWAFWGSGANEFYLRASSTDISGTGGFTTRRGIYRNLSGRFRFWGPISLRNTRVLVCGGTAASGVLDSGATCGLIKTDTAIQQLDMGFIIPPGFGLGFRSTSVNVGFSGQCWWHENRV